ncbi:aminotransferase class V-fold PLP-dependent enzyme [Shigella flexneri]
MQALDIEFYAFSGHNDRQPASVRCIVKANCSMPSPWLGGGKMIREVTFDGFTTRPVPWPRSGYAKRRRGDWLSTALEWLCST